MIGWPSTATSAMSLSFVCENCGHNHGYSWTSFHYRPLTGWSSSRVSDETLEARRLAVLWELGERQRRLARAPLVLLAPSRTIRHRDMKPDNVMRPRRARRGRVAWRSRPGMARIVRLQREGLV